MYGTLVEKRYPSGRVVKNEFESDGDLARIYGTASPAATERTYANTFSYAPDGRIAKLRLGNGLWEAAKFNTRLQVTELALGRGVASGDVWKLGYEYGELQTNGTVDAAKNTGNIAKQTLSFAGLAQPFVQTYKYDSLYRLTEARETAGTGGSAPQTWRETFGYDRYGNRTAHDKFHGTTQAAESNITDPTIDPNTNRFNTGQGYTFDKNGNLTVDAQSRGFTFNGDNKQIKVEQSGGKVAEYFYDGEGKRVKKKLFDPGNPNVVTEETIFVYSSGKLIAEYSTAPAPANPTTSWTVTDQLGSPRVIVNSLGAVVSRRDFMPFGEAAPNDASYRTMSLYPVGDNIRQKFTGYQKDDETGLDFAEARMYENRHARFRAVDPLLSSGKSAAPQSFNRYVYVMNSPLRFTDPSGLQVASWTGPVYTNGRSFSPNAFVGESNSIIQGANTRYVDATDGYSYSFSESGSTLLGRTSDLNARAARMMPDRIQTFLNGFGQTANDATSGMAIGATNFSKGVLNTATDAATGGSIRSMLGYENPFALERTPYENPKQAAYGFTTEVAFTAWSGAATGGAASAGTARSSLSVVPRPVSPSTALAETPQSILMPGGSPIGTVGSKPTIREVPGGMDAANSIMNRLISTGAERAYSPTYPGQLFRTNQGGIFGLGL